MTLDTQAVSIIARNAVVRRDWKTVALCAESILKSNPKGAEGHFLRGLTCRAQRNLDLAVSSFSLALELDVDRYDAAIELANVLSMKRQNGEAADLLDRYTSKLNNSPRYLDLAGTVYSEIGLQSNAWPLFLKANELQPGVPLFQANLATCAVFLGKIEKGKEIYEGLLDKYPEHRKNHYQLSRLVKAKDFDHINKMKQLLKQSEVEKGRNTPLYFALGKELEDLEEWGESFEYYQKGCEAIRSSINYNVENDIEVVSRIIDTCSSSWITESQINSATEKQPIFIVGLPRTGTTLVERILSSHSNVSSLGETLFLPIILRKLSGVSGGYEASVEMIEALATKHLPELAVEYMRSVDYRLSSEQVFIEKLPFNFLYLGFIARSWPNAKFVHVVRNPLDACFAMYKQVFTWAYKFSYCLDDLGRYYLAYNNLRQHWRRELGDRFVELEYESLVTDQRVQTCNLLNSLDLKFEEACLHFEKNTAPSTTASSVQVRQKVHSDSVQKWRHFETQLKPLSDYLSINGISIT